MKDQFYDFFPYKFGPFSFTLQRDLATLSQYGYLKVEFGGIYLVKRNSALASERVREIAPTYGMSINAIIETYGVLSQYSLLQSVYNRYPWYATNTQLTSLLKDPLPERLQPDIAIYTTGYQQANIDRFLNNLLSIGIDCIIDVRANPISRKFGFDRKTLASLSARVGIEYNHVPELGVPSERRRSISDVESRQRVFDEYESGLPSKEEAVVTAARMLNAKPSVLLCLEADANHCHRGRLARFLHGHTGLQVVHLRGPEL